MAAPFRGMLAGDSIEHRELQLDPLAGGG